MRQPEIEPAACPICHGVGPFTTYALREMLLGTRETFAYARCPSCGVLWLVAPPSDMAPYYPEEYRAGPSWHESAAASGTVAGWLSRGRAAHALFGTHAVQAALARGLGVHVRHEVAAVRWMVRQSRLRSFDDPILDVGAGRGAERLRTLHAAGFRNLLGIDPYVDGTGPDVPVPVLSRSIHEVVGPYALITMHHSFEHVPDPRETMLAAARLLAPGGTLMIRTPVMGSWFWERYGESWWELDAPRHLFVHTRRSLELLAAEAGLGLARVAHDSTFVEILASEQIRMDIPWRDPASWFSEPPGPFGDAAIAEAKETAERLNLEGRAGRAIYFFRAVTT